MALCAIRRHVHTECLQHKTLPAHENGQGFAVNWCGGKMPTALYVSAGTSAFMRSHKSESARRLAAAFGNSAVCSGVVITGGDISPKLTLPVSPSCMSVKGAVTTAAPVVKRRPLPGKETGRCQNELGKPSPCSPPVLHRHSSDVLQSDATTPPTGRTCRGRRSTYGNRCSTGCRRRKAHPASWVTPDGPKFCGGQ